MTVVDPAQFFKSGLDTSKAIYGYGAELDAIDSARRLMPVQEEQARANLAKTKLNNTLTDIGIQQDKDARETIKKFMTTPESATEDGLHKLSTELMKGGQYEAATKIEQAA